MARDLSLPEELWEKVLSYLSPFEDWIHAESVCRLFRGKIKKRHWRGVKRLEIDMIAVIYDDDGPVQFAFDVKGTRHKSVLEKEKFLQLL